VTTRAPRCAPGRRKTLGFACSWQTHQHFHGATGFIERLVLHSAATYCSLRPCAPCPRGVLPLALQSLAHLRVQLAVSTKPSTITVTALACSTVAELWQSVARKRPHHPNLWWRSTSIARHFLRRLSSPWLCSA